MSIKPLVISEHLFQLHHGDLTVFILVKEIKNVLYVLFVQKGFVIYRGLDELVVINLAVAVEVTHIHHFLVAVLLAMRVVLHNLEEAELFKAHSQLL
jgi:hypothetical protein